MAKKEKDSIATCSCSADIVTLESSAGLFSQLLNVITHLQGPPTIWRNLNIEKHCSQGMNYLTTIMIIVMW